MEQAPVSVPKDIFRSARIPAAAILYILTSLLGIASVVLFLTPDGLSALREDLILGGITDPSALKTWSVIYFAGAAGVLVGAVVMSVSLVIALVGRPIKGMLVLSTAAEWAVRGLNVLGIGIAALLAFKVLRYTVLCFTVDGGIYYLYTMLLSEALMAVVAGFLFMNFRRYINSVCDASASMANTRASGELSGRSIPGFAGTGFLLVAVFQVLVGVDRLFTLTIVDSFPQDYYKILVTGEPALLLYGLTFAVGACANILMWLYLRRYKRATERLLYQARKGQLGQTITN